MAAGVPVRRLETARSMRLIMVKRHALRVQPARQFRQVRERCSGGRTVFPVVKWTCLAVAWSARGRWTASKHASSSRFCSQGKRATGQATLASPSPPSLLAALNRPGMTPPLPGRSACLTLRRSTDESLQQHGGRVASPGPQNRSAAGSACPAEPAGSWPVARPVLSRRPIRSPAVLWMTQPAKATALETISRSRLPARLIPCALSSTAPAEAGAGCAADAPCELLALYA